MIVSEIKEATEMPRAVIDNEVWTLYLEETDEIVCFHCDVHCWKLSSLRRMKKEFKEWKKGETRECYAWCPSFKVFKFALIFDMRLVDTVVNEHDGSIGYLVKEGLCQQDLQQ